MDLIIESLSLLLTNPKEATANIDLLFHQDLDFIPKLTDIIVSPKEELAISYKILRAALTTFNALAVRAVKAVNVNQFYTIQQIFGSLRAILYSKVDFKEKLIILPCLSLFISEASMALTEVKQLKKEASKQGCLSCLQIVLEAAVVSKLPKIVKIEAVNQLLPLCLAFNQTLIGHLHPRSYRYHLTENLTFPNCILQIHHFEKTLQKIATRTFAAIKEPYQFQIMERIYENEKLGEFLLTIVKWQNPVAQQYAFPWLCDLRVNHEGVQLIDYCAINNMKELAFEVISSIISKTEHQYNLEHTERILMKSLPDLCEKVLADVALIARGYQQINEEFTLEGIVDRMHYFLAECVRFIDLLPLFSRISHQQLLLNAYPFLSLGAYEHSIFESDPEDFVNCLEGIIGQYDIQSISKYSITKFINRLCKKLDGFCTHYFTGIYNSLIFALLKRAQQNNEADFYEHLLIGNSLKGNSLVDESSHSQIYEKLPIETALIGIACIQRQLDHREDLQKHMKQLIVAMDLKHFKGIEIALIFFIFSRNIKWIEDEYIANRCQSLINWAFDINEEDESCFMLALNFIKTVYDRESTDQHRKLITQAIYNGIVHRISSSKSSFFFQTVRDIVCIKESQNLTNSPSEFPSFQSSKSKKRSALPLAGDFSLFLVEVLKKCYQRQLKLFGRENHDELLTLKIHYVFTECYHSLFYLKSNRIITIEQQEYNSIADHLISDTMGTATQSWVTLSEVESLIELLCIMITSNKSKVKSETFEHLFPAMLNHPYGSNWLICICEFTDLTKAKFTIPQTQCLLQIIVRTLQNQSDEQKINQISLLSIVILSHYQPQNWARVHEIVRSRLIRAMHREKKQNAISNVTVIRLFHVYLFGFKLEHRNQLLEEILDGFSPFVEKYCLVEAAHLVLGLRSSYRFLTQHNFDRILDIVIQVLKKLHLNANYYGDQTRAEADLRLITKKIKCLNIDPYQQFKIFLQQLEASSMIISEDSEQMKAIKGMMGIKTVEGQPRKVYSIRGVRNS